MSKMEIPQPIIKIYPLGKEEYQISICKALNKKKAYEIMKELAEIYLKELNEEGGK